MGKDGATVLEVDADAVEMALGVVRNELAIEGAISKLVAHLNEHETPEGVAILRGLFQKVNITDGVVPTNPTWTQRYENAMTDSSSLDWPRIVAAVESPMASDLVRARLGHLTWAFHAGRQEVSIAAEATAALLRLAAHPDIDLINRYPFAVEAFHLSKQRRDPSGRARALQALLTIIDEVLATAATDPQGGTFLLAARQYLFAGGSKSDVRQRAEQALLAFSDNSYVREDIALLMVSCEPLREIQRQIVGEEISRLLDEAATQPGFMKEGTARRALDLARTYGLREAAGEASTLLAGMSPADYDFRVREFSVELGAEEAREVNDLLKHLDVAEPKDAWTKWALCFPPLHPFSQRPAYEISTVDRIATLAVVNSQGHVSFQASNDDDIIAFRFRQQDNYHYQSIFSLILRHGLKTLLARTECVAEIERRINGSELFTDKGRARIRKAFGAHRAGDWDSVADTLPTIESAIRVLAVASGVSIYNANGAANVFKTLGGLILDLTARLDTARGLGRFWQYALTDPLGLNIRNDYLHGFQESLTEFHATALIQIYVQLLYFNANIGDPSGDVCT
ncbi:hypothetical protein RI444_18275 [Paenarthrobacter sp. AT5]|uniref:hypothetical protein n=1 Tax=Paenarthrobacter TaxID=1742992 RepID=UPI001A9930F7|nr:MULTISPECIES: hypothetical protein [Paenarthrobacter]QSZ52776.1 hypothetical protein AYX19_07040 [Paenarthrobacter ureafaciens]WOC60433.1 hypothetical protein RI444_18275 [Paenarthrobacter sp. AT5]